MTKRTREWQLGLQEDLKNQRFAQEFIIAGLEEGLSLKESLARTIRAYGVEEFAKKISVPSSNLQRTIRQSSNPTIGSLDKILSHFGMKLGAMQTKGSALRKGRK